MSKSRGPQRERAVRKLLEADGWIVVRPGGSLGAADLVAMRAGAIRMTQVKSDASGPYHSFSPADRRRLVEVARQAGAVAELAHWPPHGKLTFIPSEEWPQVRPVRALV